MNGETVLVMIVIVIVISVNIMHFLDLDNNKKIIYLLNILK